MPPTVGQRRPWCIACIRIDSPPWWLQAHPCRLSTQGGTRTSLVVCHCIPIAFSRDSHRVANNVPFRCYTFLVEHLYNVGLLVGRQSQRNFFQSRGFLYADALGIDVSRGCFILRRHCSHRQLHVVDILYCLRPFAPGIRSIKRSRYYQDRESVCMYSTPVQLAHSIVTGIGGNTGGNNGNTGWQQPLINAAYLGMTSEAAAQVIQRALTQTQDMWVTASAGCAFVICVAFHVKSDSLLLIPSV